MRDAHDTPLAHAFFTALDAIVWTRGTGGVGVGNDEDNRESDSLDGGGNYETFCYGPRGGRPTGKSEQQIREAFARAAYTPMYGYHGYPRL